MLQASHQDIFQSEDAASICPVVVLRVKLDVVLTLFLRCSTVPTVTWLQGGELDAVRRHSAPHHRPHQCCRALWQACGTMGLGLGRYWQNVKSEQQVNRTDQGLEE